MVLLSCCRDFLEIHVSDQKWLAFKSDLVAEQNFLGGSSSVVSIISTCFPKPAVVTVWLSSLQSVFRLIHLELSAERQKLVKQEWVDKVLNFPCCFPRAGSPLMVFHSPIGSL